MTQATWRPLPENEVTQAFEHMLLMNEWHDYVDCVVCRMDVTTTETPALTPVMVATIRHALRCARLVAKEYTHSGMPDAEDMVQRHFDNYAQVERWLDQQ